MAWVPHSAGAQEEVAAADAALPVVGERCWGFRQVHIGADRLAARGSRGRGDGREGEGEQHAASQPCSTRSPSPGGPEPADRGAARDTLANVYVTPRISKSGLKSGAGMHYRWKSFLGGGGLPGYICMSLYCPKTLISSISRLQRPSGSRKPSRYSLLVLGTCHFTPPPGAHAPPGGLWRPAPGQGASSRHVDAHTGTIRLQQPYSAGSVGVCNGPECPAGSCRLDVTFKSAASQCVSQPVMRRRAAPRSGWVLAGCSHSAGCP